MLRLAEHLSGRSFFDKPSPIHDQQTARDTSDDAEIMRNPYDGRPSGLLQFLNKADDLLLYGDIECSGRLIGDHKFRSQDKSHGYYNSLAHASGKFVREGLAGAVGLRNADLAEDVDRTLLCFAAIDAVHAARLRDLIADAHDGI